VSLLFKYLKYKKIEKSNKRLSFKRIISLSLIFLYSLTFITAVYAPIVSALDGSNPNDDNKDVWLYNNTLYIRASSTKANSWIKYQTIGYTAKVIIGGNTYKTRLEYSNYSKDASDIYSIPFTKNDEKNTAVMESLIADNPTAESAIRNYWANPPSGEGTIQFDAIMIVKINGVSQGIEYNDANSIINATYQSNGKSYKIPWSATAIADIKDHFNKIFNFKSQADYMEIKNPAIDVDFDLLCKVIEYQDTGFKDKTAATDTEITNWRATVIKVGGGSGAVYTSKDAAEKDLAKGLPAGEYKVTVYADDKENDKDIDYVYDQEEKTIIVIKPDTLTAIAIEKAKDSAGNKIDTVEIGQTFTVTAEESTASKGAKIVEWKHFVSVGNSNNFNQVSDQKEFQAVYNTETLLYYYVQIRDTAGIEATSSVITVKVTDNSPSLADAEIYSPDTYYEGIYETVANLSTFEYKGDTYDAKDAEKKRIGSSSWKFQDLDLPEGNHGRLQTANHDKKDWSSSEGGKLRFFEIGHKQLWLQAKGKGSVDIDTQAVNVIALPEAVGEIIGNKKNREIYIYNKSLFKPKDAWQDRENGEIDNSKTKITITNLETGQTATSVGGSAFNSTFVKGVSTEFGEVNEGDYTHIKNDVTKVVFIGDDTSDQKTERFKIQIQVTDKRGNTDTWKKTITIFGDQKPVALLKGLFSYIRNPVTKSAYTDIEVHSYSPDLDTNEKKIELNGAALPIVGDRKKVDFTPTKTGEYTLNVNIIERFISSIISALRSFLTSSDEKQDNKDYVVKVDNIAPTASFSAITPSYINMQTFINNEDISNFDNEMTSFISNMQNSDPEKNITINNVQSSFINNDGWFDVTDTFKAPADMINEVNTAKAQGKSVGFMTQMLDDAKFTNYFVVANAIETSLEYLSMRRVRVTYTSKARFYDLRTKTLVKENITPNLIYTFNLEYNQYTYEYYYKPTTKLPCNIGSYDDLSFNPFYLTTEDKIKKIDATPFSAGLIFSRGIFYENESEAYYTTADYTGVSYGIRSLSVKRYDKKENTVTTILHINDIVDFIPISYKNLVGRIFSLLNVQINGAIVKGQYLVTALAKYAFSDDRYEIPYVIHFNSSGKYVRTAALGAGDPDIRISFSDITQGGCSTGSYLPYGYNTVLDDTKFGAYNVDTGAVTYQHIASYKYFPINHKYIGIRGNRNRNVQIIDVSNNSTVFSDFASFLYPTLRQIPQDLRNNPEYDRYAIIYNGDQETLYMVDIPTGTKTYMHDMGDYINNDKSTTVIGDYYYFSTVKDNKPILKRANFKTGQVEVVDSYFYNYQDFPLNPDENGTSAARVLAEENPLREIKEYWIKEPVRGTGAYKIQYAERIINSLEKLNNYPSSTSQANLLPIITSNALKLSDMEINKIIEKVNEINIARAFTNKIKIVFLDIGGLNVQSGQQLATATGGAYYNCTNPTDVFTKLGNYIKSMVTPQKGSGTIRIKVGDIINLAGTNIDYEGDPITIEQYRSQGKSWGTFATGIQNLGSNRLKFTQQGTYVLEYQVKDSPPTVNIDTSKYSNIAKLTVIVGNGSIIDPPTQLPPDISLTIRGSKADGSCVERHRVDFIINGFPGTNPIDWNTLDIRFNQTDYLPYVKPTTTAFSRIFKNVGNHSITITLKDTTGLTTTETFEFMVLADKLPNAGFTLTGDGKRNESGVAEFTINETVSSTDDEIGSVEYFLKAPKYTIDTDGNIVQDGEMYYPMLITDNTIRLEELGTREIKQLVTEYYENGIGLDGVDLNQDGYRVFKTAQAIQNPEVKNIPPELTYSVEPTVILKGGSVSYVLDLVDDTELGDTIKYKFVHNANLYNSDGTHPKNNIETDEPTVKLDYKGLYDFYAKAIDEDGSQSEWVYSGQIKVVSLPIADFELYSNLNKNGGENFEYQNNIFKTGSTITLKNLSDNPDYGITREDHGLAYMKIEYRQVGNADYTTIFEGNTSSYVYELDLPVVNNRAVYEVRLTVRSIDGFEAEKVKQFTLLELRMDAALEPNTIYASQSYTIKATLSKDALGVVAKDHAGNWVTLDKVGEDAENQYYEKIVTTANTLQDNTYLVEVYGEYPFGNELRKDLLLTVNTPVELKSDIQPLGPAEYVKILQDNNGNNDYIHVPASEKIQIEATIASPIPLAYVKAQLEGEGEIELSYNAATGKYESIITIPASKPDKDYYNLSVTTKAVNGNVAWNNHKVRVTTPISLIPTIPFTMTVGDTFPLTATTTKYPTTCQVTLFRGTEHETTLSLSATTNGNIKSWAENYTVSDTIPEGTYIAQFRAVTPNGNVEVKNINFSVETLQVSATLVPNPALAGDQLIFTVNTKGFVDKIEIFVDPDIIAKDNRIGKYTYPLVFNVNSAINEKTDVLKYILCVWTEQTLTKDNIRKRPEYTFVVRGYRGSNYKEVELKLDVRRSVLELIHPGVKTN
jgi:hypothetical protein